jgi:hypothetical protein
MPTFISKVADANEDFDHWKATRRCYLTSSDVFTWREVDIPDWWGDTREDIIHSKLTGEDKVFDPETETSVAHGSFDERNIQAKFAEAVGCAVEPMNALYVNSRWPFLGASIDGFGFPILNAPTRPEFCQDRRRVPRLRKYIDKQGVRFITEVKKSTSTKWPTAVPEYYKAQVQTQLAILEMPYAIIMAETVVRGKKQKWRQYWDLCAHVIEADPAWLSVMDEIDIEFADALALAKKACYNGEHE